MSFSCEIGDHALAPLALFELRNRQSRHLLWAVSRQASWALEASRIRSATAGLDYRDFHISRNRFIGGGTMQQTILNDDKAAIASRLRLKPEIVASLRRLISMAEENFKYRGREARFVLSSSKC